jgi:hypothetical protein
VLFFSRQKKNGVISGVPISPRGPKLSHLFFADDSIIFCKANSEKNHVDFGNL